MGRMADLSVRRFDPCIPRVTGFSGIFHAHFALSLDVDSATLQNVQTRVNKKKRVRPRNKVNVMTTHGTAPRCKEVHRIHWDCMESTKE